MSGAGRPTRDREASGSQSLRSTAAVLSKAATGAGSINGVEGRQGREVDARVTDWKQEQERECRKRLSKFQKPRAAKL